jgi:hypothetical protein
MSFFANCRFRAVAGKYTRGIRQHKQAVTQRAQDLLSIAAGKVGSPD